MSGVFHETLGNVHLSSECVTVGQCNIKGNMNIEVRDKAIRHEIVNNYVQGNLIINGENIDVAAIVAQNTFRKAAP